jgi:1-acyl-sn-glycerol-3-phosphate acyltransferase
MAKQELFEMPRIGRFMSWYGAFPVKQNAPDRSALNRAIELLKAGETVCIFPEGGVAPEGELKELQGGAALIVRKAECAVICCGIENTREMMPADSTKLRKSEKPVTVRWGEPRSFNKKSPAEEILAWASEELRSLIS